MFFFLRRLHVLSFSGILCQNQFSIYPTFKTKDVLEILSKESKYNISKLFECVFLNEYKIVLNREGLGWKCITHALSTVLYGLRIKTSLSFNPEPIPNDNFYLKTSHQGL